MNRWSASSLHVRRLCSTSVCRLLFRIHFGSCHWQTCRPSGMYPFWHEKKHSVPSAAPANSGLDESRQGASAVRLEWGMIELGHSADIIGEGTPPTRRWLRFTDRVIWSRLVTEARPSFTV
eukprot:scaffold90740_cov63-Phaeocystis_antarctica.AAC.3